MRILFLAALPLLIAAAPPAERRPVIDDPAPKQSIPVDCAASYQRPCQCKASASAPAATCGWGENCVAQSGYSECVKPGAGDPAKK